MFALPLEESEKKMPARLSFISEDREARHNTLRLNAGEIKDISIKVTGIDIFGQYNGTIAVRAMNVLPDGSFSPLKELTVVVNKKPVASIEVLGLTDGTLEWTMDNPKQQNFSISLRNPADGIFRKITIDDFELRGDPKEVTAKIISKKSIILEPLHNEQIDVAIEDLASGTYRGTFIIRDEANKHFHTQIPIRLINPHLKWRDLFKGNNLLLILLVLSGAACSLLMTKSLTKFTDTWLSEKKYLFCTAESGSSMIFLFLLSMT